MPARKIQNEQEVLKWLSEGRTYTWMAEEYQRKYDMQVAPSMFSNFRARRGLDRRIERNDDLIPWHVLPQHRWRYPLSMLRAEARRRAGFELRGADAERLPAWLSFMEEQQVVVHYDPDLEEGFVYVPREPGDDDLIRRPRRKTTLRRRIE